MSSKTENGNTGETGESTDGQKESGMFGAKLRKRDTTTENNGENKDAPKEGDGAFGFKLRSTKKENEEHKEISGESPKESEGGVAFKLRSTKKENEENSGKDETPKESESEGGVPFKLRSTPIIKKEGGENKEGEEQNVNFAKTLRTVKKEGGENKDPALSKTLPRKVSVPSKTTTTNELKKEGNTIENKESKLDEKSNAEMENSR